MKPIEQILHKLGQLGISQSTAYFPDTITQRKCYAVNYDEEIHEYVLVFWYGRPDDYINFRNPNRYSQDLSDAHYVMQGQKGYIFVSVPDSDQGVDRNFWSAHHYTVNESSHIEYDTEEDLITALNALTELPTAIVDWVREPKRLQHKVRKLVSGLRDIGKQWVADRPPEQQYKRYYSVNHSRWGLHQLIMWTGKRGSYPWNQMDVYDTDIQDFHHHNVFGKYALIIVSVWGYSAREIVAYTCRDLQVESVAELLAGISDNLDSFFENAK